MFRFWLAGGIGFALLGVIGCGSEDDTILDNSSEMQAFEEVDLMVQVEKSNLEVGDRRSVQVHARMADGTMREITQLADWSSENPSVARVEDRDTLRAISAGATTLTVSYRSLESRLSVRVDGVVDDDDTGEDTEEPQGEGADLVIADFEYMYDSDPYHGDIIRYFAVVKNLGDMDTDKFYVDLWADRESAPSGNGGDDYEEVAVLKAGETIPLEFTIYDAPTGSENWKSWIRVDSMSMISETSEDNNTDSIVVN